MARGAVCTIVLFLLSATAAHAQWESTLTVGNAIPQGAARKARRTGESVSLSILRNAPTRAVGVGLDFSLARMHGKTVLGLGGPIRAATVSIWSVNVAWETTDRSAVVSPLLGAAIGFAGTRMSDDNRNGTTLTVNGIAGLRATAGRVGASVGASHRIILTQRATASDTEILRYGTIFVGVRARL